MMILVPQGVTCLTSNPNEVVYDLSGFSDARATGEWRLLPQVHAQSYSQVLWVSGICSYYLFLLMKVLIGHSGLLD